MAFSKGHYKNEFQLSNLVSTGFWTIRVQAGEQVCTCEKLWKKTVPKHWHHYNCRYRWYPADLRQDDWCSAFRLSIVHCQRCCTEESCVEWWKVWIESEYIFQDYLTCNSNFFPSSFTVSVSVDYAFGKTMRGTAVVSFYRFRQLKFFERIIHLGKEVPHFAVDILNDLGIRNEETVDIELEFTDSLSDLKVTATTSTVIQEISKSLYVNAAETFRRSSILNFEVLARRFDGSLVSIIVFID